MTANVELNPRQNRTWTSHVLFCVKNRRKKEKGLPYGKPFYHPLSRSSTCLFSLSSCSKASHTSIAFSPLIQPKQWLQSPPFNWLLRQLLHMHGTSSSGQKTSRSISMSQPSLMPVSSAGKPFRYLRCKAFP